MTDEKLVKMLKEGDEDALDEIYRRYCEKAYKSAYLIMGNNLFCDDIVQDTFITCYRSIKNLREEKNFRAWFYKILTNTALRYKKKSANIVSYDKFIENTDISEKKAFTDMIAQNSFLYECIRKLSIPQQTAVILHYFAGLTLKETARATNTFEATVKSRLFHAKKKLKMFYEKGGSIYER